MTDRVSRLGRAAIGTVGLVVAAGIGWFLFVRLPTSFTELLGIVLVIGLGLVGARLASRIGGRVFPPYNVAEVEVSGPITRSGRGPVPTGPVGTPADRIVDQIEAADDDDNATALLLKLNTPGGEVVPSEDIRLAAESFDGPTVAYATDLCASGGYWIAAGCDELWARDATLVGSIGVRSALVNVTDLADRVGLDYEGFSKGKYKDAGTPLKELTDEERSYFEGLSNGFYDRFVATVAEGFELDEDDVRDTEARIYLGEDAVDIGLVDNLGDRDDVEAALEETIGEPVTVQEFEPSVGLTDRLRGTAQRIARSFGEGLASVVVGEEDRPLQLR